MDPRLLQYYEQELSYIREAAAEFAEANGKIARRLGIQRFECEDPYVERLLEGFAFLAARVQLKLDAEFPRFTENLLDIVYPHCMAPTPSMAVVQMMPDLAEGALAAGFSIPKGSTLRSAATKNETTVCEFRTGQEITLWPIELTAFEYLHSGALSALEVADDKGCKAGLRIRLRCAAGLTFGQLAIDALPIFLCGAEGIASHLYEQILANATSIVVRPASKSGSIESRLEATCLRSKGFADADALLPYGPPSFEGYRFLREYFAFPERFHFVEISGLASAIKGVEVPEIDVFVLLDRASPRLSGSLTVENARLFCAPATNLFPKRLDRVNVNDGAIEFHVVADRTRPMDFEVYQITQVHGFGREEKEQQYFPFYTAHDDMTGGKSGAYYAQHRVPRLPSAKQRRYGHRSTYIGSEIYLSIVDADEAPYRSDLRQLAVEALCTNRDLPLLIPIGQGTTDFSLEAGAPVNAIRCVAGPSKPLPATVGEKSVWQLLNHLSLNYLSLADGDKGKGAAGLGELLKVYALHSEATMQKRIEGIHSVTATPIVRRIPASRRTAFGRGLQVAITLDEAAFEGESAFPFGAVLEQFLAKYVSINSFTETVLKTLDRGKIMTWPPRIGRRQAL